nr:hypothetical protein [Streptomyces sp. MH191]
MVRSAGAVSSWSLRGTRRGSGTGGSSSAGAGAFPSCPAPSASAARRAAHEGVRPDPAWSVCSVCSGRAVPWDPVPAASRSACVSSPPEAPVGRALRGSGAGTAAGSAALPTRGSGLARRSASRSPAAGEDGRGDSAASGLIVSSSAEGRAMREVTPPPGVRDSVTVTPQRRARVPTTNRPSTFVGTRSSRSRRTSRAFSSASRSALMPRPWSAISMWAPSPAARTATSTGLRAGENDTAFSISSATISVRSPMMSGSTMISVSARSETRW